MVTKRSGLLDESPRNHGWVLLAYDMPRKPSSHRVRIWRSLKRLGAELLHGSMWVLPATMRSQEEFKWLAAEITEAGGHASTWLATSLQHTQEQVLRDAFVDKTRAGYHAILDELDQGNVPLEDLIQRFRALHARDYFGDSLGAEVRQVLLAARRRKTP